ncbi:MAG TPA: histidine phosphatase family protein [Ruminococcaceae bacterium]|nr:histidine phosphatase family protein [Oscillospiraceae bacterium]
MNSPETLIYLIRHCEARGNVDRIFQGHTDAEISEKGKIQLKKLGERFAGIRLDALYSSPLIRAKKTARAVLGGRALEILKDERVMEINGGAMEGMPWKDFPLLFKESALLWNLSPGEFEIEGGESMRSVYARMRAFLLETAEKWRGGVVAVCSHGCAIRNAVCFAKGYDIQRLGEVAWSDNTAVSLLRFDENGNCGVVYENDASHLDESLSTLAGQSWWRKESLRELRFE